MPLLAVQVEGDEWKLWMAYARRGVPEKPGERNFEVLECA